MSTYLHNSFHLYNCYGIRALISRLVKSSSTFGGTQCISDQVWPTGDLLHQLSGIRPCWSTEIAGIYGEFSRIYFPSEVGFPLQFVVSQISRSDFISAVQNQGSWLFLAESSSLTCENMLCLHPRPLIFLMMIWWGFRLWNDTDGMVVSQF